MSIPDFETAGETVDFSLIVTGRINRDYMPQFIESLGFLAPDVKVIFNTNDVEATENHKGKEGLISKHRLFEYCDEAGISRIIAGRAWTGMQKTAFDGKLLYHPPDASYWAHINHVDRRSLVDSFESGFDPTAITNVGQKSVEVMLGFLGMSNPASN